MSARAKLGLCAGLCLLAIPFLFPTWWMVTSSLKPVHEIFAFPPSLLPTSTGLDAYRDVFDLQPFGRQYLNSGYIAAAEVRLLRLYSGFAGAPQFVVRGMVVHAELDGDRIDIGRLAQNEASPADLDLAASAGLQRLRLVFTQPSQADTIARVFEVEVYGQ